LNFLIYEENFILFFISVYEIGIPDSGAKIMKLITYKVLKKDLKFEKFRKLSQSIHKLQVIVAPQARANGVLVSCPIQGQLKADTKLFRTAFSVINTYQGVTKRCLS
jgi:hypothetical protein